VKFQGLLPQILHVPVTYIHHEETPLRTMENIINDK